jgi:hypothetical protein
MTASFLDRFRARPLSARPPAFDGLAAVRAYWEGLRHGGQLPQRAALDPRGLCGMLDRVFLAERIGTGLVQLRIAGSGLSDLAGLDLRGLPLSCLFTAESRPLLAQTVERALGEPAAVELDLGSDRRAPGAIIARLVLLPLASEGDGAMLLGALGLASQEKDPCKFQILARREERLQPAPASQPPAEPRRPADAALPGEDSRPLLRRFGHLSLVHSAP